MVTLNWEKNKLKSNEKIIVSDTLSLEYNNKSVQLLNTGIAWPSDKQVKFRNPQGSLQAALENKFAKPKFWSKPLWELDPENPDNNGFQVSHNGMKIR